MTTKSAEALFELVEARTSRKKAIYITTNFTRETLIARFDDQETAIPLVARLIEFSKVITL
jgi:DNA replication protein DnaC